MRKNIAAANWKMNGTLEEAKNLTEAVLECAQWLMPQQEVVLCVPFPFLQMVIESVGDKNTQIKVGAQNVHHKEKGAYTGEVSAPMLASLHVNYVIIGHSERREYFQEDNVLLAEKTKQALIHRLSPIFCCGEPLEIRDQNGQNDFVAAQLQEGLFHLGADDVVKTVIAYEPIWAIGTGRTASLEQAETMHQHIRQLVAAAYGDSIAQSISILYGGSVKADNALELFQSPSVDGGLVGGASLVAHDFLQIVKSLKR
jgi:triosephosphate isomerase